MHQPELALGATVVGSLQLVACQPIVQQTQPAATEQSAEPIEPQSTQTTPEPEAENLMCWWNEVAFHKFFTRSFMDSIGIDIGSFQVINTQSDCFSESGALFGFLSAPPLESRQSTIFVLNK